MELTRHPRAHPLNAPGPFFVENGECISCGVPEHVAPDLIGHDYYRGDESSYGHCYFKKQPETPGEIERAILAVNSSCCGALLYGGDDRKIKWQCSNSIAPSTGIHGPISLEPEPAFNKLFQSPVSKPDLFERIHDWITDLFMKVKH